MTAPTILLDNVCMRAFIPEDAEPLYEILGNVDVIRYMPWKETPPLERVQRLVDQQIQHWQDHACGWWALESVPGARLMGWCGLQYLPETNETEVGYLLGKEFWGKGIATSTSVVSLAYGFKTLRLPRIVALVHPENHASIHVIDKLGMHPVDRINLWNMDLIRYALNKKEYARHNRKKPTV